MGVKRSFCRLSVAGGSGVSEGGWTQGLKYSGVSGLDTQDEHARRKHQISLKGKQTVNVFPRGCVRSSLITVYKRATGHSCFVFWCYYSWWFALVHLISSCLREQIAGNRRTTFTHERVSLKFDLMLLLVVDKFYGDFNVHMVQRCCSCMFVYFNIFKYIICLNIGQGVLCRSIYIFGKWSAQFGAGFSGRTLVTIITLLF